MSRIQIRVSITLLSLLSPLGSMSTHRSYPRTSTQIGTVCTVFLLFASTESGHAQDVDLSPQLAEIHRLISDMYGVVQSVHEVGAEVEFLVWTSNGAVTLVSCRRVQQGGSRRGQVSLQRFRTTVEPSALRGHVGAYTRYLTLTFKREPRRWKWLRTSTEPPEQHPLHPPEGRSIPMSVVQATHVAQVAVSRIVDQLYAFLRVPIHGRASVRLDVVFDDDRIVSGLPGSYQATLPTHSAGRSAGHAATDPSMKRRLRDTLLAFSHGLGQRTIAIDLRGVHVQGERSARWTVTRAHAHRSPQRESIAGDIVDAYRREHEQIIVRWRQGLRDSALMLATFTMEQVALWVVGGWLFKPVGAFIHRIAPRFIGAIRGLGKSRGKAAAEYLETQLTRLPRNDQDALRTLMAKTETKGFRELNHAEVTRLETLFQRMEAGLTTPLTRNEKRRLRRAMHKRLASSRPAVMQAFQRAGFKKDIHHRIPLEWAHRFPKMDINATNNLVVLEYQVHKAASAIWTRFRTAPTARVTKSHVESVARIGDRHFKHWYNKPPASQGLNAAIQTATNRALADVDKLVATVRRAGR